MLYNKNYKKKLEVKDEFNAKQKDQSIQELEQMNMLEASKAN